MHQLQLNPKNTHFLGEVIVLLVSLIVWLSSIIKPSTSVCYYECTSVAYMQRVQTKPGLLCISHVCILCTSHIRMYTCTYLTCRNCYTTIHGNLWPRWKQSKTFKITFQDESFTMKSDWFKIQEIHLLVWWRCHLKWNYQSNLVNCVKTTALTPTHSIVYKTCIKQWLYFCEVLYSFWIRVRQQVPFYKSTVARWSP